MTKTAIRTLDLLAVGSKARVHGFQITTEESSLLANRFEELGFIQNTIIEVLHMAPFSKDPIAVSARGSTFALRRSEAAIIQIKEV